MLETIEQYLKEHAQDESLKSGLTSIEEQFDNLSSIQKEIAHKETKLKIAYTTVEEASKSLGTATKQSSIHKQELKDPSQSLQESKDTLKQLLDDKLLGEYRTEEETLLRKIAYIKIKELEEHRAKLEDGKPCPFCGSTKHPYAKGDVCLPDEIELKIKSLTKLISKTEKQEATIKHLQQSEITAFKNLNESQEVKTHLGNDKKIAEKTLSELNKSLSKLKTDFEEIKLTLSG